MIYFPFNYRSTTTIHTNTQKNFLEMLQKIENGWLTSGLFVAVWLASPYGVINSKSERV